MRIGHGTAPLPVPRGTPLGGYVDRRGGSSGVLDPLQVDCVSVAGGADRFVLVVAEVLCVNEDLAEAVRERVAACLAETGEAVTDVWVCATHTHSAPDVGYVPGGGTTPSAWRRAIADAAVAAALAAVATEQPLAGAAHAGVLDGIGSPRGDDGAGASVAVDVVRFADADGVARGVLAVVPVHPTVLPATSTVVSGDLLGAIRVALRRELAPQGAPWVVVTIGAAGDISTRRTRRAQTPEECRRLGTEAARQLATLLRGDPTRLWDVSTGPIRAVRRTLTLPARTRDPAALAALRIRLEQAHRREREAGATAAARTLETALHGVAVAEADASPGDVPVALSAARLGRLALFAIGGEPFASVASDLRRGSGAPTVLLGCANGHIGYVPDEPAHATSGYEVLASPLTPEAAATTVAALLDLSPDPMEDR